jgi:hypothetical protein
MLPSSITAIILAAILFEGFFLPSSLTTAQLPQQQEEQQQQTTTTPPSSSLSITTIPPLTPQELEQQNRLQSTIAATTRDLNETEKQVSGVVFTPRWSEPIWVNANSIAVLVAYCLPGEFADSGQEILGGFELEVLESYAVDLPQGFMAWMAVVGNQADVQDGRRLPAALGVICASDLNRADTRILSPEEQQEINNVISQFSTIQNTQITNIDQVINIIDNVTGNTTTTTPPPQNETGGGMTPQPPANDTGPTEEQLPKVEANVYPPVVFVTPGGQSAEIVFDADATGGSPPYEYFWSGGYFGGGFVEDKSFRLQLTEPNCKYYPENTLCALEYFRITVYDSKGYYAYDDAEVRVYPASETKTSETNVTGTASASATEPPLRVEAIANATQAVAPATIRLDAHIFGGAPPYSYSWSVPDFGVIDQDRGITQMFFEPGTFTYGLTVTDSRGKVVTDNVQIVISERGLPTEGIVAPEPGGIAPPPLEGGVSPGVPEGGEGEEPEGGVSPPSTTEEQGGGGEEPSPPPPPDDTGEEGEGTPPSTTTEEEPTTPPEGGG